MTELESNKDLEELAINTIRGLSMDAPHAANSGHQGTAMALAPIAHVLFTRILRYSAQHQSVPLEEFALHIKVDVRELSAVKLF